MMALLTSRKASWIALGLIVTAGVVVTLLAPSEQTLGEAVKVVYVHVALSRAGGAGFYIAGAIGLVVLFTGSEVLSGWMRSVGWSALILFAVGLLVSALAQAVSWGGIAWQEPRVSGALNLLAVAAIVQVLNTWLQWIPGRGLLRALLAAYALWTTLRTPNVLHPGNAISGSSSFAIQASGTALFVVGLLFGAWIVWQIRLRVAARTSSEET